MNFTEAEKIANAILYEGYILYPYRPSAIKNRQRWNFGTLYPRCYANTQRPPESSRFVSECLALLQPGAAFDVKTSFLQFMNSATDSNLEVRDATLDWKEAVERTNVQSSLKAADLLAGSLTSLLNPAPGIEIRVLINATLLSGGACKLRIELENISALDSGSLASREDVLPYSLISAHMLLGVAGGEFVSLLDPPEQFTEAARSCTNNGVFPVLAGKPPDRSILLISPIILYDHPQVAPESAGDFFDGTEIDEMLSLRVLTLTDTEKAEMRTADPHTRRILERTESLTRQQILKLHAIARELRGPCLVRGDAPKDQE